MVKSDAALMVLSRLRGFRTLGLLRLLPRAFRDFAYDLIARNRYRLFGATDVCMVPRASDQARFLS